MTAPGLRTELDDGILRVTVDRPSYMNALDDATCAALISAFEFGEHDVRVVVLTGSGGSFSAGADVVELATTRPASDAEARQAAEHTMHRAGALVRAITGCPVPVIAQVNGPAVGIGASMALASDLIYASEDAYFLFAFSKIGLMPDGASSVLVPAAIGRPRTNALMLLAERMPAEEAFAVGLINDVVPAAVLGDRVDAVAARLVRMPRRALELTKRSITDSTLALDAALRRETEGQIELLTSPEFIQRVSALASPPKKSPQKKGA